MKEKNIDEKTLKATVWYLICDFITKGTTFITMPLFTRMMSASEIGSFSILTSWISILSVVVTLNLVQSVFLAKYDYKNNFDGFVSTIAILGLMSATFCYIIILPFRSEIAYLLSVDDYAIDVMFVHLMFCQVPAVLLAKYRANFEYKKSVLLIISSTVIVTLSSILCTIGFSDSLKGRVYGTYVSTVIINIFLFIFFLFKKGSFNKGYCKYALTICWPLIIHNLAGNLMHSSDRVMIGKVCSNAEAGLYGVAYTCAMSANIIRNSMNAAWNPWVFEQLSKNKSENIKKSSYLYITVFFVLCIGIILLAPEILFILGGKSYASAKYVVPPVVSAYMFSMVYSLYEGIEQYYKKQKYFACFAIACAAFNILLNAIFIPMFGYGAAAYTTMAGTGFECLLHYINVKKMKMTYVYNGKFNVLILVTMLAISMLAMLVYHNNTVRYVLIILLFIISIISGIKNKIIIKELLATKLNKN